MGIAHSGFAEDRAAAARALDTTDTTAVTEQPASTTGMTIHLEVTVAWKGGPELDESEVAERLVDEVETLGAMFIEGTDSDGESEYETTSATYHLSATYH